MLGEGDIVPADATLRQAAALLVDESTLTGESVPADKDADGTDPDAARLQAGTVVVRGRAVATVTATGAHSALGVIATSLHPGQQLTPLQKRLSGLGSSHGKPPGEKRRRLLHGSCHVPHAQPSRSEGEGEEMSRRSESPRGHVVVGTDGSRAATHALEQAAGEAHRRRVPLEIVHAWPWGGAYEPLEDDAPGILAKAARHVAALAPEVQVTTVTVADDAAEVLVRRSRAAALTVVGTRGNGGFTGLLLGSVSLRVAAHCRSPLLVVRDEPPPRTMPRVRTVVVGVRGEEDAPAASFAFAEALRREAGVSVVHAWAYGRNDRTHSDRESRARREESAIELVVAPLHKEHPLVHLDNRSVRVAPARALIDAGATGEVVVIATHRRKHTLGMQLGPVTHALLHHACCHVVLVPVLPSRLGAC